MWNTHYKEEELWIKVPMVCNSSEEKTEIILGLMELLERNIKIFTDE